MTDDIIEIGARRYDLTALTEPLAFLPPAVGEALKAAHSNGRSLKKMASSGEWLILTGPAWQPGCVYRIVPRPPEPMIVPWSALAPEWRWAAADEGGTVWVYDTRPQLRISAWYQVPGLSP